MAKSRTSDQILVLYWNSTSIRSAHGAGVYVPLIALFQVLHCIFKITEIIESQHEISSNMVCATSKGSNQPTHTRSLIEAFVNRLNSV